MNNQDVVDYMKVVLGPIIDAVKLTDEALNEAATMTAAAYKADFADMTDEIKWRALAEFFALDVALNFAAPFYKFSSDNTSIQGSDVFSQIYRKWQAAANKASTYLAEAGIYVNASGSNFAKRTGKADLNYLTDIPYVG
jgi:hypothetical protein